MHVMSPDWDAIILRMHAYARILMIGNVQIGNIQIVNVHIGNVQIGNEENYV